MKPSIVQEMHEYFCTFATDPFGQAVHCAPFGDTVSLPGQEVQLELSAAGSVPGEQEMQADPFEEAKPGPSDVQLMQCDLKR